MSVRYRNNLGRPDIKLVEEMYIEYTVYITVSPILSCRAYLYGTFMGEPDKKQYLKKNLNASKPSEHTPDRKKNVRTFRWEHRLQIQNLLMAFKWVPRW